MRDHIQKNLLPYFGTTAVVFLLLGLWGGYAIHPVLSDLIGPSIVTASTDVTTSETAYEKEAHEMMDKDVDFRGKIYNYAYGLVLRKHSTELNRQSLELGDKATPLLEEFQKSFNSDTDAPIKQMTSDIKKSTIRNSREIIK